MGIGMGWPNASAGATNSYLLLIMNCAGNGAGVYSESSTFGPGIYVYSNPQLTLPFDGGGGGVFWNTYTGSAISGGYEIGPTGDVKPYFGTCA